MNQHRKTILFGLLGLIVVAYLGDWLMHSVLFSPLESYRKQAARLEEEIAGREKDLAKARKAAKEMDGLRRASLPSNTDVARSLYRAWLLEILARAGLTSPNVDSSEPVNRKGLYHVLSFTIRGKGTLAQLATFLYEFYRAGHLHQIRSLSITPMHSNDLLDLSIAIEALVLRTADRKDRLNLLKSDRLASENLEDYQVIVQRNLFGVGGGGLTDPTAFTFLTSVNYVDGQPEVWFSIRTTDTVLKLRKGEVLEVGQFKGAVADITDADVILDSDGERWLLTIGENLAQAAALPPER